MESRTFRGTVQWDPAFQGCSRWEYDIVFAEDFGCVVGGLFQTFGADGNRQATLGFGNPRNSQQRRGEMIYVRKPGALMAVPKLSDDVGDDPERGGGERPPAGREAEVFENASESEVSVPDEESELSQQTAEE